MTKRPFALVPVRDVEALGDEAFVATSAEPWLAVTWPVVRDMAGAFVTVTYRASLWDAPARPLLRFLRDGTVLFDAIAPAPLGATAIWTGRVPVGTTAVHVSPTSHAGRFGFRIESIQRRAWPALLIDGYRRAPGPARSAVLTKLIGWWPESDHNLAWVINSHPPAEYAQWSALRARPPERKGLDRPRTPWDQAPAICVVILVDGADATALSRTLDSLLGQSVSRWQALVLGEFAASLPRDSRIAAAPSISEAAKDLVAGSSWFGVVPAGATIAPEALAIVAERRAREPLAQMVYGDEIDGGRPHLKPGWSPRLANALPYLGHAVFATASLFAPAEVEDLLRGGAWHVPPGVEPLALRRILVADAGLTPPRPRTVPAAAPKLDASAAIIVLTRDQPTMLIRLVASIRARTRAGTYRIVLVDNGEAGGPAAAALAELDRQPDIAVLPRPGPFNFSALCNEAARSCDGDVLVFLNDDMEVLSDGWLERLVALVLEPGVGALGARLTYPDGRLQHVGVLAGMGGSAGHFGAPAPGDDPGWAGRNGVVHEVSAVTGACLAVARDKFEAVGGFDAIGLPIELSDIDLCLKLDARGWQTLVDPGVHLLHEESFSRGGATFRRLTKYGDQRAVFVERWRHLLRDDPVFHPAMSLYSWHAALG